jgi:predicted translin family RNA/ssDNA-binding protein
MYNKDFILRMIEMLGELIAGILGLIRKGDFQQASQFLENAYYDFLKHDAALFRSIGKDKLTEELIKKHNYTNGHLEILSELFYAEAELLYAKGNRITSLEFYEKTLILHEFVVKESKTYSFDKQSKKALIQNRIAQLKEAGF